MSSSLNCYGEPILQYGLSVVTAPTVEPIDVATAQLYLRVETPDDAPIIQTLIEMARRETEAKLERTLINTTWRLTLDEFPDGNDPILLPKPPLSTDSSNVAITYDSSGVTTTWASSNYTVDYRSEPGRIYPAYGYTWPSPRDVPNAVNVQYVAGYGASGDFVPAGIRTYMLRLIAENYENREVSTVGTIISNHRYWEGMLDPYRWTLHYAQ